MQNAAEGTLQKPNKVNKLFGGKQAIREIFYFLENKCPFLTLKGNKKAADVDVAALILCGE